MKNTMDVLIIGGGPGGLSAALTLSRGGKSVVVCDDGRPRNAPAAHMQNFPSQDGVTPETFRNLVKKDLEKYEDFIFLATGVADLTRMKKGFKAILKDGSVLFPNKILLAHGVVDMLPPIPGVELLWGKSIFHCPYCHGYEHKGQPLAFIIEAPHIIHAAATLRGLSQDVIIFTNGTPLPDAEVQESLRRNNIKLYAEKISRFIHQGEQLKGVELNHKEVIARSYLFFKPAQKLKSDLGTKLGCRLNEQGMYILDASSKTTEDGVYAAGDIAEMRQSVLMASASGCWSAVALNSEINQENFIPDSLA